MKFLKSVLLLGILATVTYVSNGSSIGDSKETPLVGISESNFKLADGTTTTTTTRSTTRRTTTTSRQFI